VRVTLDLNCLIDVEEIRQPHVELVLELQRRADAGTVELSIPASAASERRSPDKPGITNFGQFQQWVATLGFRSVDFLAPIMYLDFSFLDYAVLAGGSGSALEEKIHHVVAPNLPYQSPAPHQVGKWRNAKCDVQAVWCHLHYGTDALCTRDRKLISRSKRLGRFGAHLRAPADLVAGLDEQSPVTAGDSQSR
jgi:hypothetical protein